MRTIGDGDREQAGDRVDRRSMCESWLFFAAAARSDDGDEGGEERDGRDDRRADGDALGHGLGGVAHGVEVGQDLAGVLVRVGFALSICVRSKPISAMPLALSAMGPKTSIEIGVAGEGEHADAAHRDAVGDEDRVDDRM